MKAALEAFSSSEYQWFYQAFSFGLGNKFIGHLVPITRASWVSNSKLLGAARFLASYHKLKFIVNPLNSTACDRDA